VSKQEFKQLILLGSYV